MNASMEYTNRHSQNQISIIYICSIHNINQQQIAEPYWNMCHQLLDGSRLSFHQLLGTSLQIKVHYRFLLKQRWLEISKDFNSCTNTWYFYIIIYRSFEHKCTFYSLRMFKVLHCTFLAFRTGKHCTKKP